ncbi:unnamed protein product [Darwinula stevensoni]|uniref:Chitinase n=1 Tax=Darwinula stevensoni TaxID=69355 RepID=A0A7R8X907_9CRUS|nr:unnamed protein product [Darwinula stevensoni]CAG0889212.1 unnamed protein product [Darwinula stevensoni]
MEDVCENIAVHSWKVMKEDQTAVGPYAYKEGQWVGYDDEDIARRKAQYVREEGLGGIMFWSVDNDDFRGLCNGQQYPLIEASKEALFQKGKEKNTTPSSSSTSGQDRRANAADFSCKDEGFFTHPKECTKYFWCLDTPALGLVSHLFTCPSGLYFNSISGSCDFPTNVICLSSIRKGEDKSTTTSRPIQPTTTPYKGPPPDEEGDHPSRKGYVLPSDEDLFGTPEGKPTDLKQLLSLINDLGTSHFPKVIWSSRAPYGDRYSFFPTPFPGGVDAVKDILVPEERERPAHEEAKLQRGPQFVPPSRARTETREEPEEETEDPSSSPSRGFGGGRGPQYVVIDRRREGSGGGEEGLDLEEGRPTTEEPRKRFNLEYVTLDRGKQPQSTTPLAIAEEEEGTAPVDVDQEPLFPQYVTIRRPKPLARPDELEETDAERGQPQVEVEQPLEEVRRPLEEEKRPLEEEKQPLEEERQPLEEEEPEVSLMVSVKETVRTEDGQEIFSSRQEQVLDISSTTEAASEPTRGVPVRGSFQTRTRRPFVPVRNQTPVKRRQEIVAPSPSSTTEESPPTSTTSAVRVLSRPGVRTRRPFLPSLRTRSTTAKPTEEESPPSSPRRRTLFQNRFQSRSRSTEAPPSTTEEIAVTTTEFFHPIEEVKTSMAFHVETETEVQAKTSEKTAGVAKRRREERLTAPVVVPLVGELSEIEIAEPSRHQPEREESSTQKENSLREEEDVAVEAGIPTEFVVTSNGGVTIPHPDVTSAFQRDEGATRSRIVTRKRPLAVTRTTPLEELRETTSPVRETSRQSFGVTPDFGVFSSDSEKEFVRRRSRPTTTPEPQVASETGRRKDPDQSGAEFLLSRVRNPDEIVRSPTTQIAPTASSFSDYDDFYDYDYSNKDLGTGNKFLEYYSGVINLDRKIRMMEDGRIKCLDAGLFPHPNHCKKFISCVRMKTGKMRGWIYTCPSHLAFDPIGGMCNWNDATFCGGAA